MSEMQKEMREIQKEMREMKTLNQTVISHLEHQMPEIKID